MKPEERQALEQSLAEDKKKQQMIEQIQFAMAEAKLKGEQAKAGSAEAKATKDRTEAMLKAVEGFLLALETATGIQMNPSIVGAADALIEESRKAVGGGNGQPPKPQQQITQGPGQ